MSVSSPFKLLFSCTLIQLSSLVVDTSLDRFEISSSSHSPIDTCIFLSSCSRCRDPNSLVTSCVVYFDVIKHRLDSLEHLPCSSFPLDANQMPPTHPHPARYTPHNVQHTTQSSFALLTARQRAAFCTQHRVRSSIICCTVKLVDQVIMNTHISFVSHDEILDCV